MDLGQRKYLFPILFLLLPIEDWSEPPFPLPLLNSQPSDQLLSSHLASYSPSFYFPYLACQKFVKIFEKCREQERRQETILDQRCCRREKVARRDWNLGCDFNSSVVKWPSTCGCLFSFFLSFFNFLENIHLRFGNEKVRVVSAGWECPQISTNSNNDKEPKKEKGDHGCNQSKERSQEELRETCDRPVTEERSHLKKLKNRTRVADSKGGLILPLNYTFVFDFLSKVL